MIPIAIYGIWAFFGVLANLVKDSALKHVYLAIFIGLSIFLVEFHFLRAFELLP